MADMQATTNDGADSVMADQNISCRLTFLLRMLLPKIHAASLEKHCIHIFELGLGLNWNNFQI